ncbi:Carbohydrate-binding module family 14 protein [Mycena venus]|uniref:Carbohydrate-binding module family 14 protein n=1 Tax=Mycena venus TaxID=2733690 RepID=A0A8H6X9E9_9AGAR|nr:Carbohydrate-binding module family 14 protein [Mycena venus]
MSSLSTSKLLALLALVLWQVHASQANGPRTDGNLIPGYICPAEDITATACMGPKDCLYPNPEDCHSFIQCNDSGLAYVMPCAPNDLVYNDSLKQCDYPESTACHSE